jgi:eukaryotic-like serine/threonine-protein kinase
VNAGNVIAGRYELGDRLGAGGMSTVVLAFDRRLERHVAVKLLAEHLAEDAQFVARFRREALAAARLVHPNIVQVFDFGLDDATGRHYIVMEHIRGQSAAEILRDRGVLPVAEAIAMLTQCCRGLDYAHRQGVVHRDVKPGNLLRSEDGGVVKLADFGIAKAVTETSAITAAGSVLGTAAYLAPEQAAGEKAGPRADLYALGVVTYQFLSGRLPYEAQSLTELALKQQRETPTPLHELNKEVPAELAGAVDRALALDPRARYDSADAMREALVAGAKGIGAGPTRATRVVAGARDSDATQVAGPVTEPHTPVAHSTAGARVPRPPRPAPAPVAQPVAQARRGGRIWRTLFVLFLLGALAAGGAAAVILTSTDQNAVELRQVVQQDVNQTIDSIRQLIEDNTQ